jgi:serine/threonine protein kinase/lipoprotein NlpI
LSPSRDYPEAWLPAGEPSQSARTALALVGAEFRTPPAPDGPIAIDPKRNIEPAFGIPGPVSPGEGGPPSALAEYEILSELGRGGMGVVYKARHRQLKRLVALKMILEGPRSRPEQRARFAREAEAVARLQHPQIVQIYEFGAADRCPFVALEFVDGPNLSQHLAGRSLPIPEAAQLASSLARTMHYAHQQGIIHRDLKPANILLASQERRGEGQGPDTPLRLSALDSPPLTPKITDFGLAKQLDRTKDQTRSGAIVGTPNYMAPEQAGGRRRQIGPHTDVFALGAILYEMLTGRPPFDAETVWDTLMQVVSVEPIPPSHLRPEVPRPLEVICLKALAKDINRRYATAAALADDLDRFLHGKSVCARSPGRVGNALRRWRRRPVFLAGLLLAGLGASSLAYQVWAGHRHQQHVIETSLADGQEQIGTQQYAAAVRTLSRALELARTGPGGRDQAAALAAQLQQARRGQAAQELHQLADRLRFLLDVDALPAEQVKTLESLCGRIWDARAPLVEPSGAQLRPAMEAQIRIDLIDLALIWTELRTRPVFDRPVDSARQQALAVLTDVENHLGPTPVLLWQRQQLAEALGLSDLARQSGARAGESSPSTAWEHYTLGRSLLRAGQTDGAAAAFERAVEREPQGFWPNFYRGACAYRRERYRDALNALSICVALAPRLAEGYYNRALVHTALNEPDAALRDYSRALQLDPTLAPAALNRGVLLHRLHRSEEALADLQRALAHGADPVQANYTLAILYQDGNNWPAALACANQVLRLAPTHARALELRDRIQAKR